MERGADRLYALAETFRAFAELTTDYRSLLVMVASETTRLVADGCAVVLSGDDDKWLEPGAVHARDTSAHSVLERAMAGLMPSEAADAVAGDNASDAARRAGLARHVVRTGEPILMAEVAPEHLASLAQPSFAEAVRALGIRSYISVPLEVRHRRFGALSLYRFLPGSPPFNESDLVFACSIADHAALAISNAQLFESLQRELGERQRAEESAKTFVALIENSTDFIAMAGFDRRPLFLNAAGRALVGLPPDVDITKVPFADFHTSDGLKRIDVLRAKGSWQGEGVLRHFVTGELIPTQISSFIVRDTDGKPLCFATVQRDMRATRRLEEQLRQAQKMEALGRLAGGVAHDFNNLLTVILTYSALVERRVTGAIAVDVQQIERAGNRAAELTRQLLAFSRQQVLAPKALDLAESVRAMEGMIRPLVGEDIDLKLDLAPVDRVLVDAGQIEQVTVNLVVNARDAMPGGGTLSLATARIELGDVRATELGLAPGTYTTLAVTDTGNGIDEHARSRIFEPFFTTKDRGKGTGLGLSTVMGIVRQSGGHVTVESDLGRGTTFRVYLPITTETVAARSRIVPDTGAGPPRAVAVEPRPAITAAIAAAAAAPRSSATAATIETPAADTAAPATASKTIFVVEDEPEVRALVRDVLRDAGYVVLDALDGEHALAAGARMFDDIHLLLTDVIMPRMSGRQLADRFVRLHPETRVLYMSGYTDDKLGTQGVLDPGVELIQKPLTPDDLLRRVRELLAR